ncbi:restriction endonuclease subunit S, partial [Collinsella aerofaciens]|uniref:restriction endonuclease subunit S n=1 Tax=Collinsella aerofaciens TaxID=74426 RepID=UPI002912D175
MTNCIFATPIRSSRFASVAFICGCPLFLLCVTYRQSSTERRALKTRASKRRSNRDAHIVRFKTLVANTIERLIGSDGSPYEKRVDARGRVTSDKCITSEVPFEELPEGWCWTRLESVAQILNGDRGKNYPAKSKLHDSGIPFVSAINVERGVVSETSMLYMTEDQYDLLNAGKLVHGDMVFYIRGSLGKFGIFPFERGAIASSLVIVRLIDSIGISVKYLSALFDSALTAASIKRFNNGTAQPNLSAANFQSFLYPIPPLAEQRRIVERVNELMPLVEEYGELEGAREELDAALPGRLRKSVLQLAVQGGLVPQDPADEPAGVLLERIRGQRRRLVAEGKMRAPKGGESIIFAGSDGRRYEKRVDARGRESDPVCIEDEIPFEIPEGWEWARL